MVKKMPKKVILVTGVDDYWGRNVVAQLLQNEANRNKPEFHIVGVSAQPPKAEIKGIDYIQADIRNPLLTELLKSEKVDTVCHLVFSESVRPMEATFDLNVMGTMKVLGACADAGVRKVILKSSMAVYGASATNPAYLTEKSPFQGGQSYGYNRNLLEIESFCNGFIRQHPDILLTILRFSNIVGPESDTPMTRFLKEPLAPVLLGFDPLMQVIHEKDVVNALVHSIEHDHSGAFNIAADGILPLTRLMALAAKIPIPVIHLCAYWGVGIASSLGLPTAQYWPIEPDFIRYSWVGDAKQMRENMAFSPSYTAEAALREFAAKQRLRHYVSDSAALAYDEERLRDTLERRRRERELI